tara:strand:+ start:724 stop:993 length:270 start_codon:yes stop_codon:yes gene_type:complete
MNILNDDLHRRIMSFAYPTEEQMEFWKMEHYIQYYKVLHDINDIIIEIKIGKNAKMKCVFSLFSWSLIDSQWSSDDCWTTSDEEDFFSS